MNSIQLPSSKEAERYVLGAALIEPSTIHEIVNLLSSEDFFYDNHKELMKAIESVYQAHNVVDYNAVVDELQRTNKLEAAGGIDYIYNLVAELTSGMNLDANLSLINDKSVERKLFKVVDKIRNDILNGTFEHVSLMINSEKIFTEVMKNQSKEDIKPVNRLTDKILNIIEENQKRDGGLVGLDTGYEKINEITNGFKRGELIILAARPSVGKSTLALNIAENMCKNDKHVAFFSLEMGYDQLIMRMLSTFSGVNLNKIISGELDEEEMALVVRAKAEIDKLHLYIDESSTSNLRDIRVKCQKLKREGHLDCIIIDYLQLLSSGENRANRVDEVGRISRGLKEMARQFEVPLLALSQLSRDIEKRQKDDQIPRLADLRESGSIEQDADIVMFIHREPDKADANDISKKVRSNKTLLLIAKNRQGMTGDLNLMFKGSNSKFDNYNK